eukprot:m.52230 g.52230  ORF g.52230 m.52230 type:complete len:482 (-) comp13490_c0_seq2:187-1632(-)
MCHQHNHLAAMYLQQASDHSSSSPRSRPYKPLLVGVDGIPCPYQPRQHIAVCRSVRSRFAQSMGPGYLCAMGKAFIDGGSTVFLFGQARLTGGNLGPNTSAVSTAGCEGFAYVIKALQAYAATNNAGPVYFGAQAACCITAPNGTSLIDWVYGAQHLQPIEAGNRPMLVQPLARSGPALTTPQPNAPWPWLYGAGDWHDANLVNNANALPVVLDYDNWSGTLSKPDDIRTLACLPNATVRAQAISNRFYHLINYNPRAFVSIPLSKDLAGLAAPAPFGNVTCYGNASAAHGKYFSANACGIVDIAAALFQLPYNPDSPPNPTAPTMATSRPINRIYWGQQLRAADATVSWLYRAILNRSVDLEPGYVGALASLPQVLEPGSSSVHEAADMNEAQGARAGLATQLVMSAEFHRTAGCLPAVTATCAERAVVGVYRALLLEEPSLAAVMSMASAIVNGSLGFKGLVSEIAVTADQQGLYAPLT